MRRGPDHEKILIVDDAPVRMPVVLREPELPTADALNNASENLARMRIRYAEDVPSANAPTGEEV